jgi:hypothetical protein
MAGIRTQSNSADRLVASSSHELNKSNPDESSRGGATSQGDEFAAALLPAKIEAVMLMMPFI